MPALDIDELHDARRRIGHLLEPTPMLRSTALSDHLGADVWLKLESQQVTGSFKVRGALNAVSLMSDAERAHGIVTASTGNHGKAVAYAGALLRTKVTVCLSRLVPANKVRAIRASGADIIIVGESQDEAQRRARNFARATGATFIPPFDHPAVIAGQGTVGLEILEQCPDVQQVCVPLSGGGLFSGVALALKHAAPTINLHGISMERGAAMHASLASGRPVEVAELPTLADSLGGGIGLDNRYTFALTRDLCNQVHLLDEATIAAAMRYLHRHEGLCVEGAGATGVATVLERRIEARGPVVLVISGSNVEEAQFQRVLEGADA